MENDVTHRLKARHRVLAALQTFAVALACLGAGITNAQNTNENSAATLRAKYGLLRDQLNNNQFQKPLYLESTENPGSLTGDIHALINSPFATVSTALNSADNWCYVMMLHLNTKHCRAFIANQQSFLNVSIGTKHDQPIEEAYPVVFSYRVVAQTPNYLRVQLNADEGPLSTRDYRIVFEAVPLDGGQTFMRLSYSYGYGMVGRMAMQVYLATIGANKVGFTVIGKQSSGESLHIGGMRGVVERNTMRYYLALEAYLGALSLPPQARLEKSLRDWFAGIERYPRQLHDMGQYEYLVMKRKEYLRQQAGSPPKTQG